MTDSPLRLVFPVKRWTQWSGPASDVPLPASIDPLLRRRLSPQGRAALAMAGLCAEGQPTYRMVFASRHGELARTHGLIEALRPESADDPSPAAFTLSVLNSTPAISSIARKDRSPALAVSAGADTAWLGLLEAALAYAEGVGPVLLVCADAPIPPVFLHGGTDADPVRAVAVLLAPGGVSCALGRVSSPSAVGDDSLAALVASLEALDADLPAPVGQWSLARA